VKIVETCEIHYTLDKTSMIYHTLQFWAEADGVGGRYRTAESRRFRGTLEANDAKATEEFRRLVARLKKEGWVETGRGDEWFSYRFSREAKPAKNSGQG
jgi:hypothetical protein